MSRYKILLSIFFFIVTWNEYRLVPTSKVVYLEQTKESFEIVYEVRKSTHNVVFERQIDVDRFTGRHICWAVTEYDPKYPGRLAEENDCYDVEKGIISNDAFNIRVEEVKKE